jgi:hypothetical protein
MRFFPDGFSIRVTVSLEDEMTPVTWGQTPSSPQKTNPAGDIAGQTQKEKHDS